MNESIAIIIGVSVAVLALLLIINKPKKYEEPCYTSPKYEPGYMSPLTVSAEPIQIGRAHV